LNSVLKTTGITGTVIGVSFALVMFLSSGSIVSSFIKDAQVIEMGTYFLRVNLVSVPFIGILFLMTNVFQAIGKALPSMILSVSRQGIVFIPVLIVANAVVGLPGIVFAQPIADISSTVLALFLYYKVVVKTKAL
ncbi:MAG: MATE family efflux transporter, partial [Anaerotignaceae bacterium]